MQVNVKKNFYLNFTRSGGAIVTARVDAWKSTPTGWELAEQFPFLNPKASKETVAGTLPTGSFTCIFKCYVEESLNGKYDFTLDADGTAIYADNGDVNTTGGTDSKVYKDQFLLVVT